MRYMFLAFIILVLVLSGCAHQQLNENQQVNENQQSQQQANEQQNNEPAQDTEINEEIENTIVNDSDLGVPSIY